MVAVQAGQRVDECVKTQVGAQQGAKERLVYGWLVDQKPIIVKSSAEHQFITLVINDRAAASGMPDAGRGIRYFIMCEIGNKRVRVAKLCAECTPYTPPLPS
jgi:hypothetical protein